MPIDSPATKCAATTQFSPLTQLGRHDRPVALSQLAEEQVFERTSLYRALRPLERQGLVRVTAGRGRAKEAARTPRGTRRLARAQPHWRAAQNAFLHEFGRSALGTLAARLGEIIDAARTIA